MEVDLETRECLESTDKSTSTGTAVFFLTLVFIAGCFIGVIVYSNMTLERGQREWVASVEKSKRAREKYYKAWERYMVSDSREDSLKRFKAEREMERAKEEECIARENFKIFRGAVNQS